MSRLLRVLLLVTFITAVLPAAPAAGQGVPRGNKTTPTPTVPTSATATRTPTGVATGTATAAVTGTATTAGSGTATSTATAAAGTATSTSTAASGTASPSATRTPAGTATVSPTATVTSTSGTTQAFNVPAGQAKKLTYDSATLDISAGAVTTQTTISITPLGADDLSTLDEGMGNVTAGPRRGYRFLPHDMHFAKKITVSLPYDPTLIPTGLSEQDLYTYFFDDQAGMWQVLDRVKVDTQALVVVSQTDHFTDMINAVVVAPDHPEAQTLNPNSMKDIKAADPGAGIALIEPPQANNVGDARLSYPIEVPPGREGMQPQLSLSYASSNGNGWLGLGWDLPVPAVSIETRWGVPRYDPSHETETYVLNGEQVAPVAHRDVPALRSAEKVFHARVEAQFRKIVRHGTGPTNYWWEVTDKQGVRSFFGGTPGGGLDPNAVLRDANGNVFRWSLVEMRDLNGNGVRFAYDLVTDVGVAGGSVPGTQLYLKSINYTQANGSAGAYTVTFIRDSQSPNYTRRPDVQIEARGGFKQVTAELLKRIEITFQGQPVRAYDLDYQPGAFNKTLLKSVTQRGEDGSAFPPHEFTYFDDLRSGNTYNGFGKQETWDTGGNTDQVNWTTPTGSPADALAGPLGDFLGFGGASALSGSVADSAGGHIYVGFNPLSPTKQLSAGAKVGFNFSDSDTLLLLLDINGDRLPDKIFKNQQGAIYFRLNKSGPNGVTTFGDATPIGGSLSGLGSESSMTLSFGAEVYVGVGGVGVNGLINDAETFTTGDVYFSDVNGDGLPDLVDHGHVLFNHLVGNVPTFTANSSDTPVPIGALAVDPNGVVEDLTQVYENAVDTFPLVDTLRRWVAPFDGTVDITGSFHLIQDASPARAQYATADGVRVAIQLNGSELFSKTISATDYTPYAPQNVSNLAVKAGDRIYFRAGSVFDGKFDQVSWDPVVTYQAIGAGTDVNGLDVKAYKASADFTLAGRRGISVQVPFDGTLRLTGKLHKSGVTTDDTTLLVLKNDVPVFSQTLAWNQTGDFNLPPDFAVAQNDVIKLRVKVDSPIDLRQLQWNPSLFYTAVTGPADRLPNVKVQDSHGNYLIQLNPPYDIDLYPADNLTAPQQAWLVSDDGLVAVTPQLTADASANGTVTFTVKRQGALVAKAAITIVGTTVSAPPIILAVTKGDLLYFDYSSYDPQLGGKLGNTTAVVVTYINPMLGQITAPSALHSATFPGLYPQPFRGWAYAGYNGNRDRATKPIDENDLNVQFDQNTKYDPRTAKAYLFYPVPEKNFWRGPDDLTYAGPDTLSSSRLGVDYISVPTPGSIAGAQAVSRFSRTSQHAEGGGATVGPLSATGSTSDGTSYSEVDYLDMNGDEFPDIVGNGHIQYTTPQGGLEANNRTIAGLGRVRESDNDASNFGVGGSAAFSKAGSDGEVDTSGNGAPREDKTGSQMVTLGLGGSLGKGSSSVQFDLLDVNGDGLPDRVTKNGAGANCGSATLCVAFNLGYGFAAFEPWGNAPVGDGASQNSTVSGSLGFNGGIYDFAGGLSLDKNTSQGGCTSVSLNGDCSSATESLLDVNGDGLPDRVRANGASLRVSFNTGNGFAPEVDWTGALPNGVATTGNTGLGGGLYFTIGIGPLCIAACYIIVNPGADFGRNLARTESVIRDVDGDGYADFLASTSDGSLSVARNRTGRTNLLKSVKRPLGATIQLDFQRTGNTYNLPQSRWVLSEVDLADGLSGDGVDTQVTTYRYEGGVFDRLEREFYGFAKVTEEQRDAAHANALYRSTIREYRTDGFYAKGLQTRELTQDAGGNAFVEVTHAYKFRDVVQGTESVNPPGLPQSTTATIFPELVRTDQTSFEGTSSPQQSKTTFMTYEYDAFGNVSRLVDAGDSGPQDDVDATFTYSNCPSSYVVGEAIKILVLGNGALMRQREADLDCATGNLTQVRQFVDATHIAVSDLVYFADGNLQKFTGPANSTGQRFTLTYEYDPVVHTHMATITDSFGYASSATYNLKYGQPLTTTDINNNQTTYSCDVFGRTATITGPYDQGGGTPTVRFSYHPDAVVPWALSAHFDRFRDPSGADTIDTVVFVDGLRRVIQTKKDATIFTGADTAAQDVMLVSGRINFDQVGRIVEQFYPVTEPLGTPGVFNPTYDGVQPTRTQYDVMNRTTRVTLPDNTSTTTAYGFGNDRGGTLQFEMAVTDANGVQKKTYRDVRHLITSIREFNQGGAQPIWTSYAYDPLQQLTGIRDDKLNLTSVAYDNLGRRTVVDSPDGGKTEMVFDLASNMVAKITANLRAQGKQITYDYDFNRLKSIAYPNFSGNNVAYAYGAPGAADNRAGRITLVTDQSGSEERFYGKLGEVVKEIKTVVGFTGATPDVYTTQYVYDTFNRLQSLTYPDGEVLTYLYDSGGQVRQATGQKGGFTYPYFTRLEYDKFEQRAFVQDGNAIRTQYSYNADNRRLANLKAGPSGGDPFQNLLYQYDGVGNVLGLKNDVPVQAPPLFGGPTNQTFTYDDLYRLTSANGTYQFSPDKTNRYSLAESYDTIDNVLTKTQTNDIVQPSNVAISQHKTTYDSAYLFAGPQPHAATHIDERTFTYDANGNQTGWTNDFNGTRRNIVWDDENRPQSIFDNGHEKKYKYNDQGERVIKRGPQGETVYVNQYFTIRNGAIGTKNVYAGTTRMVSKLMKNNAFEKDQYFYHPDHLGSSNFVTDLNGALYEHLEYFPSGETWVQEASNTQRTPYLFTSKELDEETDLYYYGARYYDPRTSQFISADPLMLRSPEGALTQPQMLDLFSYATNNPLRYTDPTGLEPAAVTDIKVVRTTYKVPGNTLEEAINWLQQNRPGEWGQTGAHTVEDPEALRTDGKGKVVKAHVTVEITVEMPEWTPPASVGPKAKAEWERVRRALETHEQGHVDIAKEKAKDIANKLIGKSGKAAVDLLEKTFTEDKTGVITKAFDKYDTDTEHGKRQGTTADFNIERQERAEQQKQQQRGR